MQNEYEQILDNLQWAKPSENVTKWLSVNSKLQPSSSVNASRWDSTLPPPAIAYLKESAFPTLKFARVTFPLPPVVPPQVPLEKPVVRAEPKVPQVVDPPTPRTEAERLFKTDQPADSHLALCELWHDMHWTMPKKQKKMGEKQWLAIPGDKSGFALLKKHRETGDRLLDMHLLVTNPAPREAEALAMNERLFTEVVLKQNLKRHIEKIYQHDTQPSQTLTAEKCVDYVEALFYIVLTRVEHRACVVDFLRCLGAAI